MEVGESETGFEAEVEWEYCESWLSIFCWRSLESVLARVELEPLVLGPELSDGAETEEDEPEEDTPELLSEFEELVAPVLELAIGDDTLLVGAGPDSGRAMVAAPTPGGGIWTCGRSSAGGALYLAVAGDMRTNWASNKVLYPRRTKGALILTWSRETVEAMHLDQGTLLVSLIREPVDIL
jgi:hypothetical protein